MCTAFVVGQDFKVGLQLRAEAILALQAQVEAVASYLVLKLGWNVEMTITADEAELPFVLVIQFDTAGESTQKYILIVKEQQRNDVGHLFFGGRVGNPGDAKTHGDTLARVLHEGSFKMRRQVGRKTK